MYKIIKLSTLGLLLAAGVLVATNYQSPIVTAHEGEDHSEEAKTEATTTDQTAEATYNYVAQPGDSYSQIARKSVQTYGAIMKVDISQAQIIAAETFLTQEAGSPLLNLGQKVSIKEAKIEAAVKKAQALTEAQLKLWQLYTVNVNFNTDKVGQA